MREVARSAPFAAKLGEASKARTEINSETGYYSLLKPLSSRVNIWRTTYYHPLARGVDAIVEWLKGAGLIPFLKPLSADEQAAYLAAYRDGAGQDLQTAGRRDGYPAVPAALHCRERAEVHFYTI